MRILFIFALFLSILRANQYDYLLFSYVLSDVESGINLQADVNSKINGVTPLYEAVRHNRLEIAYILIMNRADVNAINQGETALHKAAQNRNPQMVQLLIAAGANVNIKDETYKNTPLHYAAMNNDMASKNALLNAGADVNAANIYNITPAQIIIAEIMIPPIVLEDLNLAVSASAFKIASSGVIFNVRNLTNEPLTILSTELFINGKPIARNNNPLTIPPSTSITNVNAMQIPPSGMYAIMPDKNGAADIKAGFSIVYYAEGRVQNVFNSTQMRLQLWLPPKDSKSNETKQEQKEAPNQENKSDTAEQQ